MIPKVAIVHDYFTQRGGAERVALFMLEAFPGAPLHTSLFEPSRTYPELADADVRTSWLNNLGWVRRHHRVGLPVYPTLFSHMTIEADVVICSSSGWAHGARTAGRKIVYCHNPARWVYQTANYVERGSSRLAFLPAKRALRRWDQRAAATADLYVVNSSVVRDRVRDAYGVEASVLPPPPALGPAGPNEPVDGVEPGYLLCVSRLLPYKNVGPIITAANQLGQRVVVVGGGPSAHAVRGLLGPGSLLLSNVDDRHLRWLYANAAGLVSASLEDYGMTPLEAAAFGVPSAVLRAGGFLDTVVEDVTGVFFERPEPDSIADGITRLLGTPWSTAKLLDQAERFSKHRFIDRLRTIVTSLTP
jgi:glycosyltransferase involved in cell wall biosynthesis